VFYSLIKAKLLNYTLGTGRKRIHLVRYAWEGEAPAEPLKQDFLLVLEIFLFSRLGGSLALPKPFPPDIPSFYYMEKDIYTSLTSALGILQGFNAPAV